MVLRKIENCECEPGCSPCDECRRREFFEWNWDKSLTESTTVFRNNDREVLFNPGFSVGTVAVRGTIPLLKGYHHYWEIEMNTEVYGTDMMIGVGTEKTDLRRYSHNFVSLLGLDENSWGLSYMGESHHLGEKGAYTKCFGQHAVIGLHLDLWTGTLEYYINRKPQGIAFKGLKDKILYPMISSTAARSGMNLIFCRSYPPSLQLHTLLSLSRQMLLPDNTSLFKVLALPPGLKMWMKNNYWWIVSHKEESKPDKDKSKKGPNVTPSLKPRKKQKVITEGKPSAGTEVSNLGDESVAVQNPPGPSSSQSPPSFTTRILRSSTRPLNESIASSPEPGPSCSTRISPPSGRVLRSSTNAATATSPGAVNRAATSEDTETQNKRLCLRSSAKKK